MTNTEMLANKHLHGKYDSLWQVVPVLYGLGQDFEAQGYNYVWGPFQLKVINFVIQFLDFQ